MLKWRQRFSSTTMTLFSAFVFVKPASLYFSIHNSHSFSFTMIKLLKLKYDQQLLDADSRIAEYHGTISSISIAEDSNFAKQQSHTSISKLNEQITNLNLNLTALNELWIIKGLINEIEVFLDPELFLMNLEVLYGHFANLQTKARSLNDDLIIKYELKNKYQELVDNLWDQIAMNFKKYLPSSEKFVAEVEDVTFEEFVEWINKFNGLDDKINLSDLIGEYKVIWESYLLALNFKALSVRDNELIISDSTGSLSETMHSILLFVKFIGNLQIKYLQKSYSSKISNKLINLISENISVLINDDDLKSDLVDIILYKWNLSINLTNDNISAKLDDIYNNWLVDNYIEKVRKCFNSAKFDELTEIKWEVDKKRYQDIQDKMDDMEKKIDVMSDKSKEEVVEDEEDAWDDGWNEEWDDDAQKVEQKLEQKPQQELKNEWDENWDDWEDKKEPVAPTTHKQPVSTVPVPVSKDKSPFESTVATTIKISSVPNQLMEIINDFQIDSTQSYDALVSTILSLSTITYPSVSKSYLIYNDLQYLAKNMGITKVSQFTENLIKRNRNEVSRTLFDVLINVRVESDNKVVLKQIENWFTNISNTQLVSTNFFKFKELIQFAMEFINNWIINLILSIPEITELISENLTNLIKQFEDIFKYNLSLINEDVTESMIKLDNFKFLINNHLVDIIARFYQGDFYNLTTDELVLLIRNCFVKSELRDNYINEIIEFRNIE